jgi:hypothetical protein
MMEQRLELCHLVRQEKACRRGKPLRQADDRCVSAVRGTERVVDVGGAERCKAVCKLRVVALLARLETQVLEQHDGVV